jgi:co-chaperonin GroES (HSP10)
MLKMMKDKVLLSVVQEKKVGSLLLPDSSRSFTRFCVEGYGEGVEDIQDDDIVLLENLHCCKQVEVEGRQYLIVNIDNIIAIEA